MSLNKSCWLCCLLVPGSKHPNSSLGFVFAWVMLCIRSYWDIKSIVIVIQILNGFFKNIRVALILLSVTVNYWFYLLIPVLIYVSHSFIKSVCSFIQGVSERKPQLFSVIILRIFFFVKPYRSYDLCSFFLTSFIPVSYTHLTLPTNREV